MANYNSVEVTERYPISGPGLDGRYPNHARGEFVVTTNPAAGDTIQLFSLPPRARVMGGFVKSDATDTASAITYNVGTTATPALFFSGSTVGRTGGGVDRGMQAAGTDYLTPAKTPVILTVGASPTGGVTGGTIVVVFSFITEQPK